ncbi:MAG: hypothetical protein K6F37_03260 [Lachnospiraceae bacterium]|nr:hypothetical protein [Lachnospiraceae bacterium]
MRRKRRKAPIIILIAATVLLCFITGGCSLDFGSSDSDEIEVGDNQSLVYGYISTINGNELTYIEVEASLVERDEEEESTENEKKKDDEGSTEASEDSKIDAGKSSTEVINESSTEMPSGGGPGGDFSGEMPDMSDFDGEIPGGAGEMGSDDSVSALSGETITTMIPVGVTVNTASGTETTFSRLAAGDIIKMLMEKDSDGNDVIIEIWITE